MKSINWKLMAMYLGLVLMVMIVSGTFILLSLRNIDLEKSEQDLERYAEKIIEQVLTEQNPDEFQKKLLLTVSNAVGIEGHILDAKGKTLASTTVTQPPYPEYNSSVVIAAMVGEAAFSNGSKSTDAWDFYKEWASYAMPVMEGTSTVKYIVLTRMDISDMQASLHETANIIMISVVIALFLTAVMGYFFAQTLTVPLLGLARGAKNLAEGHLEQRLAVRSRDEIGQLTASFNHMAANLAKNMTEIEKGKNQLEVILHNMTDGVLSFDRTGHVIHVNPAALALLERDSFSLSFHAFLQEYQIDGTPFLIQNTTHDTILAVGEKYLHASFSPYASKQTDISDADGVIVVLQDITEQKKLDDMRKEFVANVSHELRTPLTTVKSYAETLLDGAMDDPEIGREFLEIINAEADRMAFLVQDLLQLSRFDNKKIRLQKSHIELNAFLAQTIRQNNIHAEAKRQQLTCFPTENDILVYGDPDRLGQVLNNIVTNAMKYSLEGASILLSIKETETEVHIVVQDNGMGIPKEDLSRVFERFYRVDKARSRAMGGTGLGLAIAKEIMEAHGGRILAESEYGNGTTMTIVLPKLFEV